MEKDCFQPRNAGEEFGFLIWQIMKYWQRGKHRLLDEFGITASQMEILSAIYHLNQEGQEVPQILVSNMTNVDPMTTSTIMRNLQKKKLISRRASKNDTRARVVEITEKGADVLQRAMEKVKGSTAQLLKEVDEEALKTQLRELLNALIKLNQQN
ncbi:MarR family transcriptional regulator [Dysgonomonas sp. 216]|uniref:MarR family winged helix-turn-helix transcriptional regulator n=1 Tax=Dysgonomonas sp. 216 TaxID=2302934 RepID=UPI0013D5FA54|nr:MarR family winged helix-turn-helix transcriptional regulator [Dysgonomonas sp. 216]NDW18892.1 MarR family transcriptional regulator [Dysgonomonas sp. 216]